MRRAPEQQELLDEFMVPFLPFHFVANIYYVGTKTLSSFDSRKEPIINLKINK